MEDHEMLDEFFEAYVAAALWSSIDNADESGGEPLDQNYDESDIAPETLAKMREDCNKFLWEADGHIGTVERLVAMGLAVSPAPRDCTIVEYAGHDFWLTRNGHGCGFWDGDWPEPLGTILDNKAKAFGEFTLDVGDDGLIYGT